MMLSIRNQSQQAGPLEFKGERAVTEFAEKYYWAFLDYSLVTMNPNEHKVHFVSPRSCVFAIKYVMNCMQIKVCLESLIRQNCINTILMEMCLPLLCQTAKDREVWKDSPKDFIYSATYQTEDSNMVKHAAKDLLQKICSLEINKNKQFLREFIVQITDKLNILAQQGPECALQKECLLHGIEAVVDQFSTDRQIRNSLPLLLELHLLPILRDDAAMGILSFRVCSLYSRIGYFIKYNAGIHVEFCQLVCQAIIKGQVPTQIKAAEALSVLVQNQLELKEFIVQDLEFILKKLLEMMEQYDCEGLVDTLKTVISSYQAEIGPHSAKVFDGLKVAYYNYRSDINSCKGANDKDSEIAEAEIGAENCLSAMNNLVHSNLLPDVYLAISKSILQLVNICILEDDETNFPTCISMLNMVVCKIPALHEALVAYYPIICYMIAGKPKRDFTKHPSALNDEQFERVLEKVDKREDVLEDVHLTSTCLQNFAAKLGDRMSSVCDFFGTSFVDLFYQAMDGIGMVCKEGDSADLVWPLKMGVALLENLPPQDHIQPVLLMVDQILNQPNITNRVISTGISVFSVAFMRDLPKTMQVLESKLGGRSYIQKWFEEVSNTKAMNNTNMVYFIRALMSFLEVDPKILPTGLNLQQVLTSFIELAEDYVETKLDEADPDYEASEEESDEFEMMYDDEDDEWDEDEDYEADEKCHYYSNMLLSCPIIDRFGAQGSPVLGPMELLLKDQAQASRLQKIIEKARRCLQLAEEQKAEACRLAAGISPFK